ncbi:MAG: TonB-dependent receptor [Thalassotalea sp.]|jgi:iron complex outermembrane receptor protein|uniref:TonB-dependent receptor n=1 Tax=Alteromonas australica TaxID=589873 RepID=A0A358DW96_9ALTE|nr:TonB-dependent receptor [Alteromonas macleodii]MCH2056008.1 TonB-dependent receptor [Thalassotalea sp.]HBU50561.1 TonB-dependent receptor [Alteromonas australica]|tara:strand:- start:6465 stop:8852 length:2388 start_codon:yes stop_codon:yes gene_type:complete
MKNTTFNLSPLAKAFAMTTAVALSSQAFAQEETEVKEKDVEKIQVTGSLGSLPGQDVESVFGFGKSILETPRSASTISQEQMERFNVSDIDELVAFAPGTFTQSFFGVAGSLDVRGTPGEVYFRGVRRLDNPGNYPTPIGASSSVDIVRGPASPIYGPAKIGGYLNFNPKSAKVGRGQYLDSPTGQFSYTTGSWDKNVLTAEVGGPGKLAGKELGYYIYAEQENSDSYYRNSETDQTVLQAAFDMDLTENLSVEFGGMYHKYDGNQNAGWNRVTQDLIDNGTYITGNAKPLDADGDGSISHFEYFAANLFVEVDPLTEDGSSFSDDMALVDVGTAQLGRDQTLIAADDVLENEVTTLYFDMIYYADEWEIKNQFFYESYENLNENAYGFSQFHDAYVIEDKVIFATEYESDSLFAQFQFSPSIRYTDFESGDDFINEFFDRRDLTGPSTALDRRLLATRAGFGYSNYDVGNYLNLGVAAMTDLTWENGWNVVLGLRYDSVDVESTTPGGITLFGGDEDVTAEDKEDGISWNASVSYKTDFGLIPYITVAEQATIVAGQGANIDVENIPGGFFDTSELFEYGVKGSFLDDSLYVALSIYEQERTDINAQSTVTNNTTLNEGTEFELRWVVNEQLVLTAVYTNIEVTNLTVLDGGGFQFGFFGAEDFANIDDPSIFFGGTPNGNTAYGNLSAIKAGIPENTYGLTATYDFLNGYAASVSVVNADEVSSGFSGSVTLPSYTLVNAGVSYQAEDWSVNLTVKNLTDEDYFRSNFPDLFGSQIVLPELPRHWNAKFTYSF